MAPRVTEAGALPAFPCRLILLWGRSGAYKTRAMHNAGYELLRTPLPRTWVNKPLRNGLVAVNTTTRRRVWRVHEPFEGACP